MPRLRHFKLEEHLQHRSIDDGRRLRRKSTSSRPHSQSASSEVRAPRLTRRGRDAAPDLRKTPSNPRLSHASGAVGESMTIGAIGRQQQTHSPTNSTKNKQQESQA
ncbi:unnamed protein product [Phytophthora fragariaefolia]|uniref:Unnamed protein product n=1 Tax=Phytophthora fragariaefolia TaxID=1490495 RepID=A0A9W6YMW4_9STRA|nr:unnamed protein product [Phytophthora fragariaefolia]